MSAPTLATFRPQDHEYAFHFDGQREPYAELVAGALAMVYTEDCFGGAVLSVDDLPSQVCEWPFLNPVTGPFHIRGADIGDTLAVHIVAITPARDHGFSSTFPHFGLLTSTAATASLQPPLEERVWRYTIDEAAGVVRFHARSSDLGVDLPLEPMIGTIGVAPAGGETHSTLTAGEWGGNLDTRLIRAGTTVFLPVNVPGAMLALGDGHARQGDGEICGVAVEVPMVVTLLVEVIKGATIGRIRLETDATIVTLASGRPLEDPVRASQHDLVLWVADLTGLDLLDAYQLVSQGGGAVVGNVVDPAYTMAAVMPKRHLPAAAYYGGVHQRLRSTATQ
jgi:amidase